MEMEEQEEERGRSGGYRECQKNHAVGVGGHAVDGCGEFLPGGPEGSLEALKCGACACHRNFHRREAEEHHYVHYPTPYGYLQVRPLPLPMPEDSDPSPSSKKRFRTKFTPHQRESMLALAERLGWRIQKQDEPLVQAFCSDSGVRRHVL